MKKIIILFLVLLLLTACGGETAEPEPTSPAEEGAATELEVRPSPTNAPAGVNGAEETTALPPTLTAVPTTAPPDASPTAAAPAEEAPTATAALEEPAPPPAETVMDGQNPDGTFYRGLASAPITMMDYSDFL